MTAFTAANSITLAAATLGWVHVPPPPVAVIIALRIVFVATEVVHARQGLYGLTERAPWVIAFSFGLLRQLKVRFIRDDAGWLPMAAAYGIGSVAAIWTIERIASFWTRKAAVYGNRKPFICIRKSGYRRPMPNGSASVSHEHLRPVLPAVQRCSWQTCRAIAWNRVTLTPTAQRLMQESCPAEKRSYFKGISSASHSGSPI